MDKLVDKSVNFLRTALLPLAVGAAHMGLVAHAQTPCGAPAYAVGASYSDPVDDVVGYMHVSVPRDTFTRANLICIIEAIRESRPSNKPLTVMFFASTAAVTELPDAVESPRVNALVRAVYVLQPENPHERLTLTPLGYGAGALSDDPTAPEMYDDRCDDALDRRCLLACDVLDGYADGFAGSVILSARIRKDGTFDRIRVISQLSNNTIPAATMAGAAIRNLESLWFEPADRERRVRATYRFGVGAAALPDDDLSINFSDYGALRFRVTK